MKEAGVILHLAKSGRLIIKVSESLKQGTILVDSKGRRIAKVLEIIGPVKSPYASAIPLSDRVKRAVKDKLYVPTGGN